MSNCAFIFLWNEYRVLGDKTNCQTDCSFDTTSIKVEVVET